MNINIDIDFGNMWDAISAFGTVAAVCYSLVVSYRSYKRSILNIEQEQANKIIFYREGELNTGNKEFYNQKSIVKNDSLSSIYDLCVIPIPFDKKCNFKNIKNLEYVSCHRLEKSVEIKFHHNLDSNKFKNLEMKLGIIFRDSANNIWYKGPNFSSKKISEKKYESFKKKNISQFGMKNKA